MDEQQNTSANMSGEQSTSEPKAPHVDHVDPAMDAKDIEENKAIAVLSYIGILVLVPLLAKKESKYAQFHAKQGLVLFIAEVIVSILGMIPFLGWFILGPLGWIFVLVLSIIGIVNTLQGHAKELPVLGSLAKSIMK